MRQLKFVSLTEDGANVVLEAGQGELFLLPIDERLRAAARGDITRLGQIEIELENPLRPRDIQARIRAGESAEQLASASRMPLDRVLRFAYPVLQEREQVTAEARRSRLRRSDGGQQRTLGEMVDERLSNRGVSPESTSWDSWRREDGGWTVVARWRGTGGSYVATWAFDLSTRSATPADETAADLVAEHPQRARGVTPVTPLAIAAAQITPEPPPRPVRQASQRPAALPSAHPTHSTHPAAQRSVPGVSGVGATDRERGRDGREAAEARGVREVREVRETEAVEPEEDRAKRARVPSWDDILLGVRRKP